MSERKRRETNKTSLGLVYAVRCSPAPSSGKRYYTKVCKLLVRIKSKKIKVLKEDLMPSLQGAR